MTRSYRSPPLRNLDPWDGFLLVDKPAGPTSHDIVDFVRSQFRVPKVGHGGTLDPAATGLLILLLGRATKLSQPIMGTDKTYEGVMELGVATDTHDAEGQVLARRDATGITAAQLEAEIARWRGDILQIPPMVSAIKKDGVPLYKLARKGEETEREARRLHIFEFSLLDLAIPLARFRVRCSKGTYVRTLCHDVGAGLGCGGCLKTLRRTRSGVFDVSEAVRYEDLAEADHSQFVAWIQPLSRLLLQERP